MNYRLNRLANGLRVLTVPISGMNSATITVWVATGSRFENKKVGGISHFLEHMVFKGSKNRPTAREIAEAVDAIGGEFNASTGKEWTNFYIKSRAGNLPLAFDVLSDMVLQPLLKEGDIDREKSVILEEMAMYEDTPMLKIGDIFEQLIFKGNPLGRDIIGTKESIKAMAREDFEKFRTTHYFAKNMLVTVAGGVKTNEVLQLAKKYFADIPDKGKRKGKKFIGRQRKPQVKLYPKKKEQGHFILGFLGNPMGHKDMFKESVLTALLGQGMSSRLFTEIREKRGLAYAVKSDDGHYVDTGYIETYAGVDIKRIDEAIKVVIDQYYGLAERKYPLSAKELKKAKEYVKGHLALSLEDTKNINNFFGIRELLLEKIQTPRDFFKGIDKVTADELVAVAKKFFVPARLNLAIIGPYKSQAKFERLLK
jgi:predicted Zn-dependent peptidase